MNQTLSPERIPEDRVARPESAHRTALPQGGTA